MSNRRLTAPQAIALGEIMEFGGRVVRHDTGKWKLPGWLVVELVVTDAVMRALVDRGAMEWTEHRDGHPVAARVRIEYFAESTVSRERD